MKKNEKYNSGITNAVMDAIHFMKKAGLPYISRKDIIAHVHEIMPHLNEEELSMKVSQSLYRLQKDLHFKRIRARKFYKQNKVLGWTTPTDDTIYILDDLPTNQKDIKVFDSEEN